MIHTFSFSNATQAVFRHYGKDKRKRGDIIRVETPHATVELYISNEGRSIRVADENGKELK